MQRIGGLALSALVVTGCALPRPYTPGPLLPQVPPFDQNEHRGYVDSGRGIIVGQAFMKRRDGAVVTCAGETVWAYPATPFFVALAAHNAAGGSTSMVHGATAAMNLARETRCDAQGNFTLTGLPEKRWLVSTRVRWMAGAEQQGGTLARLATAAPSGEDRLLLSDQDLIGPK